ncbi:hypothetical protein PACTADRAFT_36067 [Pachysolen tannophilus NRRL Y-2460]|uniref:Ubiquitin-like protease family profile domain-containing protein n=1 Tax=Pachysolen tannophilus NRRL Y-2460 TaxID=669874 RepID=A0A1E4TNW5_PACTA|nr:hypothetical protein PACTADRAFT_36067 [Pachysolen tannophilus NRRL Y-2460]
MSSSPNSPRRSISRPSLSTLSSSSPNRSKLVDIDRDVALNSSSSSSASALLGTSSKAVISGTTTTVRNGYHPDASFRNKKLNSLQKNIRKNRRTSSHSLGVMDSLTSVKPVSKIKVPSHDHHDEQHSLTKRPRLISEDDNDNDNYDIKRTRNLKDEIDIINKDDDDNIYNDYGKSTVSLRIKLRKIRLLNQDFIKPIENCSISMLIYENADFEFVKETKSHLKSLKFLKMNLAKDLDKIYFAIYNKSLNRDFVMIFNRPIAIDRLELEQILDEKLQFEVLPEVNSIWVYGNSDIENFKNFKILINEYGIKYYDNDINELTEKFATRKKLTVPSSSFYGSSKIHKHNNTTNDNDNDDFSALNLDEKSHESSIIPLNDSAPRNTRSYITRTKALSLPPEQLNTRETAEVIQEETQHENIAENDQIRFVPTLNYKFQIDNKHFSITHSDFKCLYNNCWINDSIIDFFLKYDAENSIIKEKKFNKDDILVLNSFFFMKLNQNQNDFYNNLKSWFKDDKLFRYKYIIIPINQDLHWYCCVIANLSMLLNFDKDGISKDSTFNGIEKEGEEQVNTNEIRKSKDSNKSNNNIKDFFTAQVENEDSELSQLMVNKPRFSEILVLDSLQMDHKSIKKPLVEFFIGYAKDKYDINVSADRFKLYHCHVPKQQNFNDCGIHVIYNISKFLEENELFVSNWKKSGMKMKTLKLFKSKERELLRFELRQKLIKLLQEQEKVKGNPNYAKIGTVTIGEYKKLRREGGSDEDNNDDAIYDGDDTKDNDDEGDDGFEIIGSNQLEKEKEEANKKALLAVEETEASSMLQNQQMEEADNRSFPATQETSELPQQEDKTVPVDNQQENQDAISGNPLFKFATPNKKRIDLSSFEFTEKDLASPFFTKSINEVDHNDEKTKSSLEAGTSKTRAYGNERNVSSDASVDSALVDDNYNYGDDKRGSTNKFYDIQKETAEISNSSNETSDKSSVEVYATQSDGEHNSLDVGHDVNEEETILSEPIQANTNDSHSSKVGNFKPNTSNSISDGVDAIAAKLKDSSISKRSINTRVLSLNKEEQIDINKILNIVKNFPPNDSNFPISDNSNYGMKYIDAKGVKFDELTTRFFNEFKPASEFETNFIIQILDYLFLFERPFSLKRKYGFGFKKLKLIKKLYLFLQNVSLDDDRLEVGLMNFVNDYNSELNSIPKIQVSDEEEDEGHINGDADSDTEDPVDDPADDPVENHAEDHAHDPADDHDEDPAEDYSEDHHQEPPAEIIDLSSSVSDMRNNYKAPTRSNSEEAESSTRDLQKIVVIEDSSDEVDTKGKNRALLKLNHFLNNNRYEDDDFKILGERKNNTRHIKSTPPKTPIQDDEFAVEDVTVRRKAVSSSPGNDNSRKLIQQTLPHSFRKSQSSFPNDGFQHHRKRSSNTNSSGSSRSNSNSNNTTEDAERRMKIVSYKRRKN